MSRQHPLSVELGLSNIGDCKDPADHPYSDELGRRKVRDVTLFIHRHNPGNPSFYFLLTEPSAGHRTIIATPSQLDPDYVNDKVQECFAVWHDTLLECIEQDASPDGTENARPFCDVWDLGDRDEAWLRQRIGPLALAGQDLFHLLFREPNDPNLNKIAERLEQLSRGGKLYITIESDEFFVPWRMIYIHPDPQIPLNEQDGTNCDPRGFWGYSHVIEHNLRDQDPEQLLRAGCDGTFSGSITYDECIDIKLRVKCVEPHLTYITRMPRWPTIALHREKKQFIAAICNDQFCEQIMYFFCHGEGWGEPGQRQRAGAHVRLTDGDPIRSSEILARRRVPFKPSPLVFLNACQGGQVSRYSYEALVSVFLKRKALSVIGPQIDIPALFAAEFAERFFCHLLHDDPPPYIAELVHILTGEFLKNHCNPLGLVYSVYRGIDCYAEPQAKLQRKS